MSVNYQMVSILANPKKKFIEEVVQASLSRRSLDGKMVVKLLGKMGFDSDLFGVVSINLIWVFFMPFLYNGVY